MNKRIKVKTPRGIVYCQKDKTGLYKIYQTETGGKSTGILNLDYLLSKNDSFYQVIS
jgi:hypothetical protein